MFKALLWRTGFPRHHGMVNNKSSKTDFWLTNSQWKTILRYEEHIFADIPCHSGNTDGISQPSGKLINIDKSVQHPSPPHLQLWESHLLSRHSSNALFHLINVQSNVALHLDVLFPRSMYLILNIVLEVLHLHLGLV